MIWLIGNIGMLGSEVSELLRLQGLPVVGTDREVDITTVEALRAFAQGKDVRWIINCAAYTAVDKAEDDAELCQKLNVQGPANIGAVARELGATVIHISTDYVFDGLSRRPYREDDPPCPVGVYGKTKAAGEAALIAACPHSYILRTAWLYGKHGANFVHTMLKLMAQREEIGVVADQHGSPTYAGDLAQAILAIIQSGKTDYGIYHYTGAGETTWYDFARAIHDEGRRVGLLEKDCRIKGLSTDQYPTRAHRPSYSVLSKEKIERTFGIVPPPWEESLRRFLKNE